MKGFNDFINESDKEYVITKEVADEFMSDFKKVIEAYKITMPKSFLFVSGFNMIELRVHTYQVFSGSTWVISKVFNREDGEKLIDAFNLYDVNCLGFNGKTWAHMKKAVDDDIETSDLSIRQLFRMGEKKNITIDEHLYHEDLILEKYEILLKYPETIKVWKKGMSIPAFKEACKGIVSGHKFRI